MRGILQRRADVGAIILPETRGAIWNLNRQRGTYSLLSVRWMECCQMEGKQRGLMYHTV